MAESQKTNSETGHPQGGHEAFPPFDAKNFPSQILWFAIAFGAFYLLMSRVALPRMKAIIDHRSGKIEGDLHAAQKMQEEAREAAAAYEKTLAEARSRSKELAQQTQAKVKLEQDAKRHAIEAELDHKLRTAETQIAETKANAMANVGQIANEAASAIVEHFTGKPADPTTVAAAVAAAKV
jgi:F-type H+-transporting ATPase subunit b